MKSKYFGLKFTSEEAFGGDVNWFRKHGSRVIDRSIGWPYIVPGAERIKLPISDFCPRLRKNPIGLFDFCYRGSATIRALRLDFLKALDDRGLLRDFHIGSFESAVGDDVGGWRWFFPSSTVRVRNISDVKRVSEEERLVAMSGRYFLIVRHEVHETLRSKKIPHSKWRELEEPSDWINAAPAP